MRRSAIIGILPGTEGGPHNLPEVFLRMVKFRGDLYCGEGGRSVPIADPAVIDLAVVIALPWSNSLVGWSGTDGIVGECFFCLWHGLRLWGGDNNGGQVLRPSHLRPEVALNQIGIGHNARWLLGGRRTCSWRTLVATRFRLFECARCI